MKVRRAPLGAVACPLLLLTCSTAAADNEGQLWVEAGLQYRPKAPIRLSFAQNLRFDRDFSRLARILPEVALNYRPLELLDLEGGYRFQYERDKDDEFVVGHRVHFDLQVRGQLDPVEVRYRVRFQEQLGSTAGSSNRHTLRNRLAMQLDTDTDWTPELSAELFTRLADDQAIELRKVRITAELAYAAGRAGDVSLDYRVELPINQSGDPLVHILGLTYRYVIETGD